MSAMTLGPHAVFIVASYAVAALVVAALVVWVTIDRRRLQASLDALEAGGAVRRSSAKAGTP